MKTLLFAALLCSGYALTSCGEKDDTPKPSQVIAVTPAASRTYYVTAVTINAVSGNPSGRYRLIKLFSQTGGTQPAALLWASPLLDVSRSSRVAAPAVAIASGLRVVIYDAEASGQQLAQVGSLSPNPPKVSPEVFGEGATTVTIESRY